jgi:hypothetical protein
VLPFAVVSSRVMARPHDRLIRCQHAPPRAGGDGLGGSGCGSSDGAHVQRKLLATIGGWRWAVYLVTFSDPCSSDESLAELAIDILGLPVRRLESRVKFDRRCATALLPSRATCMMRAANNHRHVPRGH